MNSQKGFKDALRRRVAGQKAHESSALELRTYRKAWQAISRLMLRKLACYATPAETPKSLIFPHVGCSYRDPPSNGTEFLDSFNWVPQTSFCLQREASPSKQFIQTRFSVRQAWHHVISKSVFFLQVFRLIRAAILQDSAQIEIRPCRDTIEILRGVCP
jgi:hypothetical protein